MHGLHCGAAVQSAHCLDAAHISCITEEPFIVYAVDMQRIVCTGGAWLSSTGMVS